MEEKMEKEKNENRKESRKVTRFEEKIESGRNTRKPTRKENRIYTRKKTFLNNKTFATKLLLKLTETILDPIVTCVSILKFEPQNRLTPDEEIHSKKEKETDSNKATRGYLSEREIEIETIPVNENSFSIPAIKEKVKEEAKLREREKDEISKKDNLIITLENDINITDSKEDFIYKDLIKKEDEEKSPERGSKHAHHPQNSRSVEMRSRSSSSIPYSNKIIAAKGMKPKIGKTKPIDDNEDLKLGRKRISSYDKKSSSIFDKDLDYVYEKDNTNPRKSVDLSQKYNFETTTITIIPKKNKAQEDIKKLEDDYNNRINNLKKQYEEKIKEISDLYKDKEK